MVKITFSDENMAGDIPTIEISKEKLLSAFYNEIDTLLENRNGKVIVCFQSIENVDYENEHFAFCISHDDIVISDFYDWQLKQINRENIHLNFFCFDTYEQAFGYCIDLKEGL